MITLHNLLKNFWNTGSWIGQIISYFQASVWARICLNAVQIQYMCGFSALLVERSIHWQDVDQYGNKMASAAH